MGKSKKARDIKKIVFVSVSVLVIIAIILLGIIYYLTFFDGKSASSGNVNSGAKLVNPAKGLSIEEAVEKFDESFVYYLLVSIKAYNLHKALFSDEPPSIEIDVGGDIYYANVMDGAIRVGRGGIDDEDVLIVTSKEEAVKMIQNKNYVAESFKMGLSRVELVSGKLELAAKGYLELYNELSS